MELEHGARGQVTQRVSPIMTTTQESCRPNFLVRGRRAIGLVGAATAFLSVGLMLPTSATTTTPGTWSFFPPQTFTDSSTTTTAPGPTAYKTAVRPPVNADGSSNFSAKRGVIPVQFDLLAAPTTVTTTTTTRTYAPPVW